MQLRIWRLSRLQTAGPERRFGGKQSGDFPPQLHARGSLQHGRKRVDGSDVRSHGRSGGNVCVRQSASGLVISTSLFTWVHGQADPTLQFNPEDYVWQVTVRQNQQPKMRKRRFSFKTLCWNGKILVSGKIDSSCKKVKKVKILLTYVIEIFCAFG